MIDYDTLVPGYAEIRAQLAAVKAIRPPNASGNSAADIVQQHLIAALAAGEQPDLLALAAAAHQEIAAVVTVREALTTAASGLQDRLTELEVDNRDLVLKQMDREVKDLVEQVKALGDLDSIATPEAAVASERPRDHKTLRGLLASYSQLRRLQLRIVREEQGGSLPEMPEVLFASDIPDHFALWAPWRTPGYLLNETGRGQRAVSSPWGGARDTVGTDAAGGEWLLWAIGAGVNVWVPSIEQMVEASIDHEHRLQPESRHVEAMPGWIDPGALRAGPAPRKSNGNLMSKAELHEAAR